MSSRHRNDSTVEQQAPIKGTDPSTKYDYQTMDAFDSRPYPPLQVIRKMKDFSPPFSSTISLNVLYNADKSTLSSIQIDARMDRGFFLADEEWVCYRRNYFQLSAVFSLTNDSPVYVKRPEGFDQVIRFMMAPRASVANSEKVVELVQQTAKRDKGPQFKPAPKPVFPGGRLLATLESQSMATFERLQFRTATANNGKRRATQQFFVCIVDLLAETSNGLVPVAMCQSLPLVVRGRSPGHYADVKRTVRQPSEAYYHYQPSYYCDQKLPYPPQVSQDWQRARYNSASSGSSSGSSVFPYQESYFSPA